MKQTLVCLLLVAPTLAQAQDPASRNAKDQDAIVKLHDEWFKAFDATDAKAMDPLERDDFTVSGDFGVVPKERQLANIRRRHDAGGAPEPGNRKFANRQFRFYGDTALITQTDQYPDGREYQDTQVWVRSGNSWKVAHLHYTLLAKKP